MELVAFLLFMLGAWLGSYSSQTQLKQLRAERDALKSELAKKHGHTDATEHAVVVGTAAVTAKPAEPRPVRQPIDNAIVLLYFGAFLFTSAIGLFLAFGGLDGMTRSLLVGIMVIAFYTVGLFIYENSTRLKPAGLTFTGIGMVLLPFFGLALHNLAFDGQYGPEVWLIISALAVVMYGYALQVTKHAYVTYFLIGSILSLFESGVAITQLPVYYFGWAMAAVAIVMLWVAKRKGLWAEVQEPLNLASAVFIPTSLLFSLVFIGEHGWGQVSMAMLLGSAFYWLASGYESREDKQVQLICTADFLAVTAAGTAAFAMTEMPRFVSLVLLLVAGLHVGLVWYLKQQNKSKMLVNNLATLTSVYVILGGVFVFLNPALLTLAIVIAIVIHAALYLIMKDVTFLAVGALFWLALPLVIGLYLSVPTMSAEQVTGLYAINVGLAFLVRLSTEHNRAALNVFRQTYGAGLVLAWLCSLAAGLEFGAAVSLILAVIAFGLSYFEEKAEVVVGASALLYVGAALLCALNNEMVYDLMAVSFTGISVLLFFAGEVMGHDPRAKLLRYSAIVGSFTAAVIPVFAGESTVLNAMALGIAGAMSMLESYRVNEQWGKEISGGIIMLAFQWLLWQNDVQDVQIFTHLWAALLAVYAVWRNALNDKQGEEGYTISALTVITVPLALQSLSDAGEFYGWLLIGEQISLVLLGMAINRSLIIKWGLTITVLSVLYQLRDLTFVVLAAVGLGLIGLAVYLLTKQKE